MHLLLIHQNFPGQFRDLASAWLASGHQVTAIGSMAEAPSGLQWQGLTYLQYRFEQTPSHLQRGLAVARLVEQLLDQEDPPDLVMSHSAWGEALCLQRVCGDVPLISYPELWGNSRSLGFGFDQALDGFEPDATIFSSANLIAELAVFQSSAAVVASRSQLLSFPPELQQRLTLLPEGVDLERIKPDPNACLQLPEQALEFRAGQPLVTFISRDLEPLRGLRQLLKAWPQVSQTWPASAEGAKPLRRCPGPTAGHTESRADPSLGATPPRSDVDAAAVQCLSCSSQLPLHLVVECAGGPGLRSPDHQQPRQSDRGGAAEGRQRSPGVGAIQRRRRPCKPDH
jgi:hypothetical protein